MDGGRLALQGVEPPFGRFAEDELEDLVSIREHAGPITAAGEHVAGSRTRSHGWTSWLDAGGLGASPKPIENNIAASGTPSTSGTRSTESSGP